jgi:hypothetical protein
MWLLAKRLVIEWQLMMSGQEYTFYFFSKPGARMTQALLPKVTMLC